MSDIIQDAKQLLDGATPGPWKIDDLTNPDYPELHAAPRVESGILMVPVLIHDIYGEVSSMEDADLIAKSWTNAKAIAEETWEYAVQVKRNESWKYTYESWSTRWQGSYSAQEARAQRDHPGEETRIVRRRVSPVEVINE